ncbi:MAG: hypothetical protein ACJAT7_002380 [Psychromonas sp.]|jgi:hypothetical protein
MNRSKRINSAPLLRLVVNMVAYYLFISSQIFIETFFRYFGIQTL